MLQEIHNVHKKVSRALQKNEDKKNPTSEHKLLDALLSLRDREQACKRKEKREKKEKEKRRKKKKLGAVASGPDRIAHALPCGPSTRTVY